MAENQLNLTQQQLDEAIKEGVRKALEEKQAVDEEKAFELPPPTCRLGLYDGKVIKTVKRRFMAEDKTGEVVRHATIEFYSKDDKVSELTDTEDALAEKFSIAQNVLFTSNVSYKKVVVERVAASSMTSDGYVMTGADQNRTIPLHVEKSVINEGKNGKYTVTYKGKEYDVNSVNFQFNHS